eukprot:scaffold119690_cov17-Tisochrysis_lutea.AAC.1
MAGEQHLRTPCKMLGHQLEVTLQCIAAIACLRELIEMKPTTHNVALLLHKSHLTEAVKVVIKLVDALWLCCCTMKLSEHTMLRCYLYHPTGAVAKELRTIEPVLSEIRSLKASVTPTTIAAFSAALSTGKWRCKCQQTQALQHCTSICDAYQKPQSLAGACDAAPLSSEACGYMQMWVATFVWSAMPSNHANHFNEHTGRTMLHPYLPPTGMPPPPFTNKHGAPYSPQTDNTGEGPVGPPIQHPELQPTKLRRLAGLLSELAEFSRGLEQRHGADHSVAIKLRVLHRDLSK